MGPYFTYQGLMQGDLISPLPFDLVVDVIGRVVDQVLIKGMSSHLDEKGVSIMQMTLSHFYKMVWNNLGI
jgi:hypothetical protein